MGSPLWMAPEQTERGPHRRRRRTCGRSGSSRSSLLTGRSYWRTRATSRAATVTQLLREIVFEPLPAASARAAELGVAAAPAGLRRVVRALRRARSHGAFRACGGAPPRARRDARRRAHRLRGDGARAAALLRGCALLRRSAVTAGARGQRRRPRARRRTPPPRRRPSRRWSRARSRQARRSRWGRWDRPAARQPPARARGWSSRWAHRAPARRRHGGGHVVRASAAGAGERGAHRDPGTGVSGAHGGDARAARRQGGGPADLRSAADGAAHGDRRRRPHDEGPPPPRAPPIRRDSRRPRRRWTTIRTAPTAA